jgi:hypothetical protein
MIKSTVALGLALSAFTGVPAIASDEFKCPFPSKPNDPAKLEQIRQLLPDVNTMLDLEKLKAMIASFQREGMSKSLMVDHLVGAYCPMVAREVPLTNNEKVALVQRFTGQATRLVYSLESGLDVIINVPLTPDVVDSVNMAARRQGLTAPGWIAMTIDNALSEQSITGQQ